MAAISLISFIWKKFKLLTPLQSLGLWFSECHRNRISASAIMKKLKNGCHFINIDDTEKFQITDPPKVWVSGFLSVDRNRISASLIMKKLKNGCHLVNIDHMEKFQITDPPPQSLGLWFSFLCVDGNGISSKTLDANFLFSEFSIGSFFPIILPRFHFNIYVWLHLKHLCVDIYASLVYPTSHLCVVLHFLILYSMPYTKDRSR